MKKVMVILVLLILAACAKEAPVPQKIYISEPPLPPISKYPARPMYEPPPTGPTEVGNVLQIEIEAKRFEFLPSEIRAKKGDTIKMIFLSTDVDHNVTMLGYGIEEELPMGQDVIIEFVVDKEGIFTYYSPQYMDRGMRGKLIVR